MNTQLTNLETALLNEIIEMYDEDCNTCFTRELTQSEKGVMSSLVKKGLVYDSFENESGNGYNKHNYFPSDI
jgi:hypothetical protein